ncbi:shikimate kinase [Kordia sp. YSTF-M3]|uniref:Shikimate kinase n=1 Tax=Kordia aestuariivivens TaxID=2759037 RepID=A0ABR7QFH7_9FLAO|nr:shikimate kinase [Kordia aestuariivivens]MBC8757131.1 shikimate kinase [Kordia aestuariivivens]
MTIILLGYMASGKSLVSKLLGKQLGLPVLDLDDFIERKEEKTIREIFETKGEIYFRMKEHQYLKEVLETKQAMIVSLGGGTPCYANNMNLIHEYTTHTFYLQTSIPEIINRVKDEKAKRPLISAIADEDLPEFIGKHLFERNAFYQQATHTVFTDKKQIEELVLEIETVLN